MFLSLFLLLLAFFILLNALATFEETKSRAVISSVAATFQTKVEPSAVAEILISTLGPVPQPEDVTADVERLWVTAVPIAKVETLTEGRVLQLSVPQNDLFVGGAATVRADRDDLLRATATALAARLEGFTVMMRVFVPTGDLSDVATWATPVNVAAGTEDDLVDLDDPTALLGDRATTQNSFLPFARAESFARKLVETGAPPGSISIGLRPAQTSRIRIRFDVVDDELARVNMRQESAEEQGESGSAAPTAVQTGPQPAAGSEGTGQ